MINNELNKDRGDEGHVRIWCVADIFDAFGQPSHEMVYEVGIYLTNEDVDDAVANIIYEYSGWTLEEIYGKFCWEYMEVHSL